MTPFSRVIRDASDVMVQRAALLAKPDDFFRPFFGGRLPTVEEKLARVEQAILDATLLQVFQNDTYWVAVGHCPPFIRLTIKRHDGMPYEQWRDLQTIKNELVGPEYEAVELFPAESRLIDTSNEYHLWVHADPNYRFPLGFQTSRVVYDKSPLEFADATFQGQRAMAEQVA
ncbi:MAG: hypothetical protein WCF18_20520 [Chthoniobacteraceae bacterium]